MTDFGVASSTIRKEVIDSMVKQIAERAYKFKQAVAIVPTSAWTNTFFREETTIPAGKSGNATSGIPRGANFPQYSIKWKQVKARIVKHGLEESIPWEDILSDDINVQARTIIKLTNGVTKSVDEEYWNGASAAIINDLMTASRLIALENYDTSDLLCFISPRDKQSIMNYLADKGAQWMPIATDIATNGRIAKVAGITLIESNSVTASQALVVKPKMCATYKELVSLRSTTIEDPYKSLKIRIVEEGTVELTDPKTVVIIKGTQGVDGL